MACLRPQAQFPGLDGGVGQRKGPHCFQRTRGNAAVGVHDHEPSGGHQRGDDLDELQELVFQFPLFPLGAQTPGGRVEDGESDEDALRRELKDKIGIDAVVGELSLTVTHEYERYHLDMCVYHTTTTDEPQAAYVADVQWVHPDAFGDYTFPGADQQTVDVLLGE